MPPRALLSETLLTPQAAEGRWTLSDSHDLAYVVRDGAGRRAIALKGSPVRAKPNGLVVALRHDELGERAAQEMSLGGRWQADAHNRLALLVERADGTADRLTFRSAWEIGPHHEVVYRLHRRRGRAVREQMLSFAGAWDLPSAGRLVYRLTGSDRSAFEFSGSLQSRSVRAAEGRIAYQVGIRLASGRTQQRRVALFGAWKLNRDLSVSFEVPYAGGRIQAMRFEAGVALSRRDRLTLELQNRRREALGLSVTWSRKLTRHAELFLRLQRDAEEQAVLGGVRARF